MTRPDSTEIDSLMRGGAWEQAFERLRLWPETHRNTGFYSRLARAAFRAGKSDEAAAAYEWLERNRALNVTYAGEYMLLLVGRGALERAESIFLAAENEDPAHEKLLHAGALAAERGGRHHSAVERLRRLCALRPEHIGYRYRLLVALAAAGETAEAAGLLNAVPANDREAHRQWAGLGLHRRVAALAAPFLLRAHRTWPDEPLFATEYAQTLTRLEAWAEATLLWDQIAARWPDRANPRSRLECLRHQRRYTEAAALVAERRRAEPDDWFWQEQQEEMLLALDHRAEVFTRMRRLFPDGESLTRTERVALAEMYEDQERPDLADALLAGLPCRAAGSEAGSASFPWIPLRRALAAEDWKAVVTWLAAAPPDGAGERLLAASPAPEAARQAERERLRLRERAPWPKTVRSVGVVGGSNTLVRSGWSVPFAATLRRVYDVPVTNRGLGASSSLYGLTAARRYDLFAAHDLLVFEYALNDYWFLQGGNYDPALLESVLTQVMRDAARHRCRVLFLLMLPLKGWRDDPNRQAVRRAYLAMRRLGAEVICVSEMAERDLPEGFHPARYTDHSHYLPIFSGRVADAVIARIRTGLPLPKTEAIRAAEPAYDLERLELLGLDRAQLPSAAVVERRATAIYEGEFCRIRSGEAIKLGLQGRSLLGLLVNCTNRTGYAELTLDGRCLLKNMAFQRAHKARIFLKQLTRPLQPESPSSRLRIAVADERRVGRQPEDPSAYGLLPRALPGEEELEIGGFLVA